MQCELCSHSVAVCFYQSSIVPVIQRYWKDHSSVVSSVVPTRQAWYDLKSLHKAVIF